MIALTFKMYLYLIFLACVICSTFGDLPPGITPIPGGFSGNGHTTRYWDCCKPACSWIGSLTNKTDNKPVRSCNIDGVTTSPLFAGSGCSPDGSSFMCVDQAPFAVNSNMAYGFAGFSHTGGAYVGKCCSCFYLEFQGDLLGKTMIVQTTNTGTDATENHFDIAIPGGGVGIFNGCAKQWNAPADGWGDRYGGVHTEKECNQLPTVLQKACKFRWTFMQGADDPLVKYQEVVCPNEITDISGCHA